MLRIGRVSLSTWRFTCFWTDEAQGVAGDNRGDGQDHSLKLRAIHGRPSYYMLATKLDEGKARTEIGCDK
jgi:hypothetical protein